MAELIRRFRAEPPLTAAARRPAGRAEPPLTAPRRPAPPEPPLRLSQPLAAAVPAAPPVAAAPEAPPPREALPDGGPREAAPIFRAVPPRPLDTPRAPSAAGSDLTPRWVVEAQRPIRPAPASRQPEPDLQAVRPETAASSLRRVTGRPRDPAPSRLSYRIHRFWLTPLYRRLVRVGLPAFVVAFSAGIYLSDEGRRDALVGRGADMIQQIQERPEFMVNLMSIEGASPDLAEAIRVALPVNFPVSSFDLDLDAMRARVAALDAVAAADLRIRPGGILAVGVTERVPAIVWRDTAGLVLLDATGHRVATLESRLKRPDLPVIAGDGADRAVPEALQLIEAAQPVAARLRGLVRMGARRWDVVLDNGQRILLPETAPLAALERVMALAEAEDMLARDVSVIDMRNGARPTLRLSPRALDSLRAHEIMTGASNG